MHTKTQARAHARALVGAVAIGSTLGFALGGAYLAGGSARAAVTEAHIERVSADAGDAAMTPIQATTQQAPALRQDNQNSSPATGFQKAAYKTGSAAETLSGAKPFAGATGRRDLDCLTTAVYYEARGEGVRGQEAVAQVILNRVRHPAFPKSVCAVVYQGCQFSFTCNGATRAHREGAAWNEARSIASRALGGFVLAGVGNATHFHTTGVAPGWGGMVRVAQVGAHIFYRFGGASGRGSAFSARRVVASATAPYQVLGPSRRESAQIEVASADAKPAYKVLGPSSRETAKPAKDDAVLTPVSSPKTDASAPAAAPVASAS